MYNLVWFGRYDYFVKLNMETKPFKKKKKATCCSEKPLQNLLLTLV